jgi:hypothetical protein
VKINGRTEAFEKVPESPREVWATDGSRMTRDFVIAGDTDTRIKAAADFLGFSRLVGAGDDNGPPYYISRQLPHGYPYITEAETFFLYAQSIPDGRPLGVGQAQPFSLDGVDATGADYTNYLMTVEYRTLSYDVRTDDALRTTTGPLSGLPDEGNALANAPAFGPGVLGVSAAAAGRYITRTARPGGKFLVLRQGMMRYTFDQKPVPEGIPYAVPFSTLSYTWHQVPEGGVPNLAIEKALGTLNNARFDGYPAETLLLTNAVPRPYRNPFGERNYDVEYTFRYQPNVSPVTNAPQGQNTILRVNAGVIDYVSITSNGTFPPPVGTGTPPYRLTDFAALFRPDQS